jgi:hypothetical protein
VDELEIEWDCLLDTRESGLIPTKPFVSKHLHTALSDVCLPVIVNASFYVNSVCGNICATLFGYDYFKTNLCKPDQPFKYF